MDTKPLNKFAYLAILSSAVASCSGGDGDAKIVVGGTLVQGGGSVHVQARASSSSLEPLLKHGAGQPIENVEVCALGECATTDRKGRWGFGVNESLLGQEVAFSVIGHNIDARVSVHIPTDIVNAKLALANVAGQPYVAEMTLITTEGEEVQSHEQALEEHSH